LQKIQLQLFQSVKTLSIPMRRIIPFLLFFICRLSLAQDPQAAGILAASHITVPPAPNASALGKFGDIPVGYYTGTPSIHIPLYTLPAKSIAVPISLDYHASGVKVDDVASWVGLGWALSAGGTISRTVRGGDDFKQNGFQNHPYHWTQVVGNQQLLNSTVRGALDTQPDLFFYSLPGASGKFLVADTCTSGKNNCHYFATPLNGIRIEQLYAAASNDRVWKVTTQDGTQYYYGIMGSYGAVDGTTSLRDGLMSESYKSGWHLAKIVAPNQTDSVLFQYDSESISYTQGRSMVHYDFIFDPSDVSGLLTQACMKQTDQNTETGMVVTQGFLKKIISSHAIIEFIPGNDKRQDLSLANTLQAIRVTTGTDTKTFQFSYSYFTNGSSKRLKLDSVGEVAGNGDRIPPYAFQYREDIPLPDQGSYSQDHWGFPNSNTASSLIPKYIFPDNSNTFLYYSQGGDREPDAVKTLAGLITRITYPTGGHTDFEFEPHDYSLVGADAAMDHIQENLHIAKSRSESTGPVMFTITEPTTIKITSDVSCAINHTPDPPSAEVTITQLSGQVQNGSPYNFIFTLNVAGGLTGANNSEVFVTLLPGTYQAEADAQILSQPDGSYQMLCNATLDLVIFRNTTATHKVAGGARIKSMTDDDGFGTLVTRRFSYQLDNGSSSGVLVAGPKYKSLFQNLINYEDPNANGTGAGGGFQVGMCSYNTYSSVSKTTLGATQGSHLGYKQVTVTRGSNGEGGKTVYKYTAADTFGDHILSFLPFTSESQDFKRGLLLSEKHYDKDGHVVKVTTTDYNYSIRQDEHYTDGFAIATRLQGQTAEGTLFVHDVYSDGSSWVDKVVVTDSLYTPGRWMVTRNYFSYDNVQHKLVSREKTINSKGEQLLSRKKYAGDMPAASIYTSMKDKNMTGMPVELQSWKVLPSGDSVLTGARFTEYNLLGSSIYPVKEKDFFLTVPVSAGYFSSHPSNYEDGSVINIYDSYGNIREYTERSGIKTSLLWGYQNTRLIAKIIGAASTQVFYTGFEDDGNSAAGDSHTGNLSKTGGFTKVLNSLPAGNYQLSYWSKSAGSWSFNSSTVTVSTGSYTINVPAALQVDDIRFYPQGALVTTYTYKPGIGITSATDENDQVTTYEYDPFWRLSAIKDYKGNVVKAYEYKYGVPADQH
jgi:YD repeat-containing protein